MEDKHTVSFRTNPRNKKALDAIAASLSRDRSFVINEAIANYIALFAWQIEHIETGLKQAQAGQFASEKEVKRALSQFKR